MIRNHHFEKILLLGLCFAISQFSYSQNPDIETLRKINSELINSALSTDTSVVSRIFGEDMVLINPAGVKMTRAALVHNAASTSVLAVTIDSVDIRLPAKDVGIVTGYLTFTIPDGSTKITGRNCYQDIYVKRNNRWVEVSAHVTMLK